MLDDRGTLVCTKIMPDSQDSSMVTLRDQPGKAWSMPDRQDSSMVTLRDQPGKAWGLPPPSVGLTICPAAAQPPTLGLTSCPEGGRSFAAMTGMNRLREMSE
jgi:hypothetical protein